MTIHGRVLDLRGPASGYHDFHPDISLNFQCNRFLEWIGPEAHDEIATAVSNVRTYEQWIEAFLALAAQTRAAGRVLAAGYYDRAGEFFMPPQDVRKAAARARFLDTMREQYGVQPDQISYGGAWLPAYDLRPEQSSAKQTMVVFGGYDSYIEEFLPMLTAITAEGHRVVAFEGPGQGSALEDAGLVLTREWERPVAAVLDHYGLDDVTAVGISLGGGLVIRAAAFEPRIRRAVAWDILDDFLEAIGRQIAPGAARVVHALLTLRARRTIDAASARATRSPVSQWGLWQGMHITGTTSPHDFFAFARALTTRSVSGRVTADMLLLAGTDDHYVPLHQLYRQARNLTAARSVTTRVFTAAEQASNHCQIGNVGAAVRTILSWVDTLSAASPPS